jgi:ABC-2 type transport system permease protein
MIAGLVKAYWKEAIAYRLESMISLIVVPLRFVVLLMIWGAVFLQARGDSLGGFTFPQLITYFILTTFITILTYGDETEVLEKEVIGGNFMMYLLKPREYIWLKFIRKCADRVLSLFLQLLPLLIIFIVFFRHYLVSGNILLFVVSAGFAFIISFLISIIIGMMAFWLLKIRTLGWLINFAINMTSGMVVPLSFYPPMLQNILYLLPFQYIIYVPVQMYLGAYPLTITAGWDSAYALLGLQLFWIAVLGFITCFIWNRAIKRFSAVGS